MFRDRKMGQQRDEVISNSRHAVFPIIFLSSHFSVMSTCEIRQCCPQGVKREVSRFMIDRFSKYSLPLLMKELQELAVRPRTYVVRVVFVALVCYFAVSAIQASLLGRLGTAGPLSVLGQGLPVLTSLVGWEFVGIYLFLPAMACGVFTVEKERNTLGLLFLTRLGPWTLITEKLLSRLFPMLMFLLGALPVMALTYAMGGLTSFQIICAVWFLMLAAFQVACVAVMCSTLSSSTGAAFLQTYFVLLVMNCLPPLIVTMSIPWMYAVFDWLGQLCVRLTGVWLIWDFDTSLRMLMQIWLPGGLFHEFMSPWVLSNEWSPFGSIISNWIPAFLLGIPSILSGVAYLLVARWALYRRAFLLATNPLLNFFRGIDLVFFWFNRRVAFDVRLIRDVDTLPGDEPIAWQEVSKRSLGKFRYLVRIAIPLMFPSLFIGVFIMLSSAEDWQQFGPRSSLSMMVVTLGSIILALTAVTAANLVPLERTRQTWEVLRSTPLTGREILIQKLRGVRRLQWVCSIPVLTAIVLNTWWRHQILMAGLARHQPGTRFHEEHFIWWEYLLGAVLCVWLYSELAKWTALWCGLMLRGSMRAILAAVPVIVLYTGLPSLLLFLAVRSLFSFCESILQVDLTDLSSSVLPMLGATWPVFFVALNETGDLRLLSSIPLLPAAINLLWQGVLLFLIRRHILKHAEWYLGRVCVPPRYPFARTAVEPMTAAIETVVRDPYWGTINEGPRPNS